jgi:nucleoside-diphosphate-sugar epimerase
MASRINRRAGVNRINQTAFVIGVTGSIGREITEVLLNRGWQVRALHRNPLEAMTSQGLPKAIEWVKGDAMQAEDVIAAATGAAVIVHAANPPNYRNWRGLALPMLDNTIAAAKASGARVLLPATVYNFGADSPRLLKENSPQIPTTRKGQVRVEMELKLQKASLYGVRSIVVRAGDFFGPGAGNSWLTRGMTSTSPLLRSVFYPGNANAGHAWAYLPDLAETMVRLIECTASAEAGRGLGAYEVFHFGGHWFERGADIAELAYCVRGVSGRRVRAFPWWAIRLAAPLVETFREMVEMRYLWEVPLKLDNAKLRALIGAEPHTPADIAVASALGIDPMVVPRRFVT